MFPIIEVPSGSAEIVEQLGTKAKFWYIDHLLGRSLFKRGRPNTGENWAEKVACELAAMLGIPHAFYELAKCGDQYGVVSPSFVPRYGRLVHGNELLVKAKWYPQDVDVRYYRARSHTITVVLGFMRAASIERDLIEPPADFTPFEGVTTAGDVFVAYLMLDAWIGNQDRHDENWGLIVDFSNGDARVTLAPSFDHGSSLARNETDDACIEMLRTKDRGRHISSYVQRARSAVYPHGADSRTRPLSTIEAFAYALRFSPKAGRAWLGRLKSVTEQQLVEIADMLPDEFITAGRRQFVVTYLLLNRARLLALLET